VNHIELSKRALKDLRRIDHANRRRLLNLLEQDLAAEPQPPNLDVKPLVGCAPVAAPTPRRLPHPLPATHRR
jgi:hypothetical protein